MAPRRTPPERSPSRRPTWSSFESRTTAWTRSSPSPEAWPSQHDPRADTYSAGRSSCMQGKRHANERLRAESVTKPRILMNEFSYKLNNGVESQTLRVYLDSDSSFTRVTPNSIKAQQSELITQ